METTGLKGSTINHLCGDKSILFYMSYIWENAYFLLTLYITYYIFHQGDWLYVRPSGFSGRLIAAAALIALSLNPSKDYMCDKRLFYVQVLICVR